MASMSARFWTAEDGVEWVEFCRRGDVGSSVTMKVSRLKKEPQWADLEPRYNAWKENPAPVETVVAEPVPEPEPAPQPVVKTGPGSASTQFRSKSDY